MIRSMTGYGKHEVDGDGVHLTVEISSVNHRYLEVTTRLPRPIASLENNVRRLVQERLVRGKITLVVNRDVDEVRGSVLRLDEHRLARYLEIARALSGHEEITGKLDVNQAIGLPDVVVEAEPEEDPQAAWSLLGRGIEGAIAALLELKTTEGAALARDMLGRVDEIESVLTEIERRAPNRVAEAQKKLELRITQLLNGGEVDPYRLEQEVAFHADRMDCTEECVRLRSHLAHFRQFASEDASAGRKLNFLLQEMNREATTIGSKANDAEIAGHTVRMKEEIERIREQVQNVE